MAGLSPYPKSSQVSLPRRQPKHQGWLKRGQQPRRTRGQSPQVSPDGKPNRANQILQCNATQGVSFRNKKEKRGAGGAEPDPELTLPTRICSPSLAGTPRDIQDANHTWESLFFSGPRKRGSEFKLHFVTAAAMSPSEMGLIKPSSVGQPLVFPSSSNKEGGWGNQRFP